MPFPNFLEGMLPPPGSSPGFAGGSFGGVDQMGGINNALAQNAMRPAPKQKGHGVGLMDILGIIGDALLVGNGASPIATPYRLQQKERDREQGRQDQIQSALANYMDDPEGAIRALMGVDAQAGIGLLNSRQKQADLPADVETYQWRQQLPQEQRQDFDKFLELRRFNPYGAPMVLGPNDRLEGGGNQGGPAPGTVEDGYRFKGGDPADQNNWEPVNGGQTPQASGGFPY